MSVIIPRVGNYLAYKHPADKKSKSQSQKSKPSKPGGEYFVNVHSNSMCFYTCMPSVYPKLDVQCLARHTLNAACYNSLSFVLC